MLRSGKRALNPALLNFHKGLGSSASLVVDQQLLRRSLPVFKGRSCSSSLSTLSRSLLNSIGPVSVQGCKEYSSKATIEADEDEIRSPTAIDVIQPEAVQLTEEEITAKRNKSGLRDHHFRLMNGELPHPEPKYWTHHTVQYKRRMYGNYGEASGINPGLMWPTKEDLAARLDYERVAYPFTLEEMVSKKKEQRRIEKEEFEKRAKEVEEKMTKVEEMKKAIHDKIAAKEREAEAAKLKREALMEEVRRHFGYTVDTRDERFQELLEKKEKAQKKAAKEAKKLERQKQLLSKMMEGISGQENKAEAASQQPSSASSSSESGSSSSSGTPPPSSPPPSSPPPPPPSKSGDDEVKGDLQDLVEDIKKELSGRHPELCNVAGYYFDGQGKAIRPLISILMARAINAHLHENKSFILHSQKQLALVSEMIHTATLVHDDVIDTSDTRRGKPSVNALFGQKKAIIGGDYILAKAGSMVARLNNDEVTQILAQVLEDLVQGEFMQMGANEGSTDRFTHYIGKTFNKTASLMAYSCKGVAVLGGADKALAEVAFQYGKHVGIAFQLVDDLLDFVSSTATMGKPAAADLQLGLATAPVLFAAEKHPELNELIERRFSQPGDVEKALDFVHNSDGLQRTKQLAQQYCTEAVRCLDVLRDSSYKQSLVDITEKVLNRSK